MQVTQCEWLLLCIAKMVVFVRKFGSFEQTELKNLGDLDTLTVEEFLKQVSQKLELKDEYSKTWHRTD